MSPNADEIVPNPVVSPVLELSKASLMFFDKLDPILFLMAFSSAPDKLARCFFRGLPADVPFSAPIACLDESASVAAADAFGVTADAFDDDCAASPEAGVFVESALLSEDKDAAEC